MEDDGRNSDAKFGKPLHTTDGWSRWFNEEPEIITTPIRPVMAHWHCPHEDCGGEMIYEGTQWMSSPIGYHHRCNKCGFMAAIRGAKYPSIKYEGLSG